MVIRYPLCYNVVGTTTTTCNVSTLAFFWAESRQWLHSDTLPCQGVTDVRVAMAVAGGADRTERTLSLTVVTQGAVLARRAVIAGGTFAHLN